MGEWLAFDEGSDKAATLARLRAAAALLTASFNDLMVTSAVGDGGDGATLFAHPTGKHLDHDVRIDYCFVSGGLADRLVSARVDRDADGSDHQPVWLEIDL